MWWIFYIFLFFLLFDVTFVIFCWQNARSSIKPKNITYENEIKWNKDNGLWRDFDDNDTKEYLIEGKDGYVLHALFADNAKTRGTGKYVIILHGHTSSRYGAVKYANSYLALGYSCIMYDSRMHGANAHNSKCTLGYIESEDLMCVIEDTYRRYGDIKVLGLQGESMGSSTALSVVKFKPKIDFIVSDCAFNCAYDVVHDCYGNIHLSFLAYPIWLAGIVFYRTDLNKTSAIKCLTENTTPVLFIHGAGDTFIKPYNSEKLRDAASKNGAFTELIFVEGAGHARSRFVSGYETYTGYIESFLEKVLSQS